MKKLTKAEIIAKLFNNDKETVEFVGTIDKETVDFVGEIDNKTVESV